MDKPKFTVLSTPPAACTEPEKAPARINIRHITMTFSSPMLFVTEDNFSAKLLLRFCKNATAKAVTNAAIAGIE